MLLFALFALKKVKMQNRQMIDRKNVFKKIMKLQLKLYFKVGILHCLLSSLSACYFITNLIFILFLHSIHFFNQTILNSK